MLFSYRSQVSSEDLAGRPRIWRRSSIQRELLIVQTTLSVLLITGAGMFAQSYRKMAGENHESRLADVLIVSFDDGPGSVRDQDQLLTDAVDRLRKVAGVRVDDSVCGPAIWRSHTQAAHQRARSRRAASRRRRRRP